MVPVDGVQVSTASLNEVTPNEHVDCSHEAGGSNQASANGDRNTLHDFDVVHADDEQDFSKTDEFGFMSSKETSL